MHHVMLQKPLHCRVRYFGAENLVSVSSCLKYSVFFKNLICSPDFFKLYQNLCGKEKNNQGEIRDLEIQGSKKSFKSSEEYLHMINLPEKKKKDTLNRRMKVDAVKFEELASIK